MSESAPQPPAPPAPRWVLATGPSRKILLIGALILATLAGQILVSGVIDEREERLDAVRREFAQSWGPKQFVGTPMLVIPYEAEAENPRRFLKIAPSQIKVAARLLPERRERGMFSAVVYQAEVDIQGQFALPSAEKLRDLTGGAEAPRWSESFVVLGVSGLAGMSPSDAFSWNGESLPWQNCREMTGDAECQGAGILAARLPIAQSVAGATFQFAASATLRGTTSISLGLHARDVEADISAPWDTPSFFGSRLPATRTVTSEGFTAHWESAEYSAPQYWSTTLIGEDPDRCVAVGGVALLEATPIYRMIHRASKYGILFVVLSFTTYFLLELLSGVRIHGVQYGLLGASLVLFGLLLVSFSEPLGYTWGYVSSAALVLLQASLYTAAISRRPRHAMIFAAMLASLFGFLYVVLSLESYALLTGSVALFVVLSLVMYLTQRVDWSTGQHIAANQRT